MWDVALGRMLFLSRRRLTLACLPARMEVDMSSSTFTTVPVERDGQGFLLRAEQWSEQIAQSIARDNGIEELTARQWQVIDAMRRAFLEYGSTPWLRMLSRVSDVPIDELYRLFPRGPSRLVAKIAGIPKLRSCI